MGRIQMKELLEAGVHFGHQTRRWNPKMKPYIFSTRKNIHILDLQKTVNLANKAGEFVVDSVAQGKKVLFVGTKMQVKKPMKDMAEEIGMPYVTEKWLGGCLTNFLIIKKLIKKYKDLLDDKNMGKLEKYTKKERLEFDREIKRLELRVGGLTKLNRLPDAIFVWDIKHEKTAVTEAQKKNVPLIAICDTNVNPKGINYIIPSNDDATKTVKLVLGLIKEAISEGKAAVAKKN